MTSTFQLFSETFQVFVAVSTLEIDFSAEIFQFASELVSIFVRGLEVSASRLFRPSLSLFCLRLHFKKKRKLLGSDLCRRVSSLIFAFIRFLLLKFSSFRLQPSKLVKIHNFIAGHESNLGNKIQFQQTTESFKISPSCTTFRAETDACFRNDGSV